jgi:hypothetical protein
MLSFGSVSKAGCLVELPAVCAEFPDSSLGIQRLAWERADMEWRTCVFKGCPDTCDDKPGLGTFGAMG